MGKDSKKFIQRVTGTFLYYARAVNVAMLVALSAIMAERADPTEDTLIKTNEFLTFSASNIVLNIHSNDLYLMEPKARSRAGGNFFMSDNTKDPKDNEAILNIAKIIKNIMLFAAEAEIGALFINSRQAIPTQTMLGKMGHPQPPTPIQTNNTTALGFIKKNFHPQSHKIS